jgi:enoyl-CoA hydratase/carnithine racemase
MSSTETLFEINDAIATLTFNRPAARNALTWEMYEGLAQACDRVDGDTAVRVFVLRGAGEHAFAAGTDIRQFAEFRGAEDGIRYEARIDAVLGRLARVAVPTIAQVQGVAAGGGCAIAFTCDLRVCDVNASFGVPIARTLGNCLSAATCARFIALLSPAVVKDLLFTGRMVRAEESQTLGLVSRLVQVGELDAAVHNLCMAIAANAPLTVRASKEIVRRLERSTRPDAELDADQIKLCYGSKDFREGVAAFIGKRSPSWRGV